MTSILIAEDSRTQAETLRVLLEDNGYTVEVGRSGEQALETLKAGTFQLVISDIMMPGMDGYELCRTVKSHPGWREIPVILLTSLTDPMDIIRGLESGADNFLTKPYDPDHLLDRISNVLENRRLRRNKLQMGIGINFLGQSFTITADKQQILDLLISTFEDAVLQNRQLVQREEELERARAELARYAGTLEERIERVLESVPDIVYSISAHRDELYYMSQACVRITGFTPEYFAADPGTRWLERVAAGQRARVSRVYGRVAESGNQETVEYPLHAADGSIRWIEETVVAVRDTAGKVYRLDCVARDITNRRQLQEQVRLAQKMEALGTLAGGIAHDFNNLLTAIQGNAELAYLDLPEDSSTRQDLQEILEVTQRATTVTRQLLALGRKQVLEPRAVDLNELIARSTGMLRRFIGEDVSLRVGESDEAVTIWADPNQIDQVLMNLSVNARHAMPSGGELVIETARVMLGSDFRESHPGVTAGEYVCMSISDTGSGMTEEVQRRIFDPFFTTKQVGEGTGLGLAVVYGIVQQHGGLVKVESELGRGTTFRIYFPFHDEAGESLEQVDTAPPTGGSETILCVEDDEAVRSVTVKRLRMLGYTVLETRDGVEALDLLRERGSEIALILTDVVMPGMSGVELFEHAGESHAAKFLFMSGYNPTASQLTPLSGLPGAVLHKPFGIKELASRVREVLQRQSA